MLSYKGKGVLCFQAISDDSLPKIRWDLFHGRYYKKPLKVSFFLPIYNKTLNNG